MKFMVLLAPVLVSLCGCVTAEKGGEAEPAKEESASEPERSPEESISPEEPKPTESKVPAKKVVERAEAALEREKAAMRSSLEAYDYFLADEYEGKEDLIPHFQAVVDKYPGTGMALEGVKKLYESARR